MAVFHVLMGQLHYLLWSKCSNLPIFKFHCLSSCYWVTHTHTLWIPVICLIYTLWIFLLNLWIFFFYFLNSAFQELKFLIWWNKIVIFPFVSYVLCPKKCLSTSRLWIFTYVFFPKFKTSVYMSYPFQVNLVHSMR